MLLTLSAHCLLPKQPRPETDEIGHRSSFVRGVSLGGRSEHSQYASIILSHILQHIFPAASVKTNEGRWVAQRLNDSGSYCLPHAQVLASLCGLSSENLSLSLSLSVLRYLFRYDGSMMPGVFVKYLHTISVLNIAHGLV